MWQGFSMGIALALSFAAVFIPATYYNKGEKMEVSMMMSGFVSFGAVSVSYTHLAVPTYTVPKKRVYYNIIHIR